MRGSLLCRISDNVLEPEDWTVARLAVADGAVVFVHKEQRGVYAYDAFPAVGADLDAVSAWSKYDGTGRHPENYCEVWIGGLWRVFVSTDQLWLAAARLDDEVQTQLSKLDEANWR